MEYGATIHSYKWNWRKNNARQPYHRYPKEIVATDLFKQAKFWYNSVYDQSNSIQLSPTFENTEKYNI